MSSTLTSDAVVGVLRRLHAKADAEDHVAKERVHDREGEIGRRLSAPERYQLYGDAPLAISREVGELCYVLAISRPTRLTVEFGASHGISTIYLASGIRDGGRGSLITTELLPQKAEAVRQNLAAPTTATSRLNSRSTPPWRSPVPSPAAARSTKRRGLEYGPLSASEDHGAPRGFCCFPPLRAPEDRSLTWLL
jgi:hypothetical protein